MSFVKPVNNNTYFKYLMNRHIRLNSYKKDIQLPSIQELKMPQLFQVLRCYKCLVFQIHQTKKSNKWQCKMCGEKQSIKRHYGIGNGKECRLNVQKLNALRGEIENEKLNNVNSDDNYTYSEEENIDCNLVKNEIKTKSKWSTYIENQSEHQANEPMYLDNNEVCLEIPCKQTKSVKTKKFIPTNKENITRSVKAPYKHESMNTAVTLTQKLIKPIDSVDISNTVLTNEITNLDKTVSNYKEKSFEKINVHRNSKWAQFVESDGDFEENEYPAQNYSSSNTQNMFQLCADTDLDDVLNI